MNGRGQIVIKPQFWYAGDFYEGRALVRKPGPKRHSFLTGYIDKTGKLIVPYRDASHPAADYSEGLVRFEEDGNWGYMDIMGNVVVKPKFYFPPLGEDECGCSQENGAAQDFHEGFASVMQGKHHFYRQNGPASIWKKLRRRG